MVKVSGRERRGRRRKGGKDTRREGSRNLEREVGREKWGN